MRFSWTIKELETVSNWKFIESLLIERQYDITNHYSPLSNKLQDIQKWVKKMKGDIPDWKE